MVLVDQAAPPKAFMQVLGSSKPASGCQGQVRCLAMLVSPRIAAVRQKVDRFEGFNSAAYKVLYPPQSETPRLAYPSRILSHRRREYLTCLAQLVTDEELLTHVPPRG